MKEFLRTLFSESGTASWSRFASLIALGFVCGWITHIVGHTHALPDLAGPAMFAAAPYGIGKINETVAKLTAGKG